MPIKFVNLLQDSWNFMRNQWQFSLIAALLIMLEQLVSKQFMPSQQIIEHDLMTQDLNQLSSILLVSLGISLIGVILNTLFVLNIHAISQGKYVNFWGNIPKSFSKVLPIVVLMLMTNLPLSLGIAAQFLQQPIIGLPLMISGFYVFIKFALVNIAYLTESPQKGITETLKYTWAMSRGRMLNLTLYCVLFYLLQGSLNAILLNLNISPLLAGIGIIAHSLLNIYMVIFSFRFYQAYRQAV